MIKRCLHIILCFWLINAVTYFHGINPFEYNDRNAYGSEQYVKINSWTDHLIHVFSNDDDCSSQHSHPIKSPHRYVVSQVNLLSSFLPGLISLISFKSPSHLLFKNISNYAIGVALLPKYYNFLFRFSPF